MEMHSMSDKSFFKTNVGLLLTGWILGDILPSGTDWIHFLLQDYIFSHQAMSKVWFVLLQIFDWYIIDVTLPLILLIVAYILHIRNVKTIKKIAIIGSIVGVSAVIGVIFWIIKFGGV
jgi:hypothetical protein